MRCVLVCGFILACVALASADEGPKREPALRMVHLADGLRSVAPGRNLGRLTEARIFRTARETGLDLRRVDDDLLVQRFEHGRLFYLFYKTVEDAIGDRPYLIQRIKKTVREWKTAESEPEETVTYQVEVFKILGGALKRPDQHYGSFALRDRYRREIVKEYEIGFGEIPGICEGTAWPFSAKSLFRLVQPYAKAVGHYDNVAFSAAKRWSLTVSLAKDGTHRVASPELGFDAPDALPKRPEPKRDPQTRALRLRAGDGINGLEVGVSFEMDIQGALGAPLYVDRFANGAANYTTPGELIVNVDREKSVNTIFTRSGFAGRTERGISLGSTRVAVMTAYGVPKRQQTDGPHWQYPGIIFYFDGWHEVERIVITRR